MTKRRIIHIILTIVVVLGTAIYNHYTEKTSKVDAPVEKKVTDKYKRSGWPHWKDDVHEKDADCLDARQETLLAENLDPNKKTAFAKGECRVPKKGKWVGLFTANDYYMYSVSDIDIDHIIPLKWAYDNGGDKWTKEKRKLFANDPVNLIAVSKKQNRTKGAKGPAQWMPPNHQYRCTYVNRWEVVLNKYELEMNASDNRTFNKMKDACK